MTRGALWRGATAARVIVVVSRERLRARDDDGARRAREETFEARVDRASRVVGGGGGGARIDDADDDSRRARARVPRGADDDR